MNLTINGKHIQSKDGKTVLDAATESGIYIPHLCNYPGLPPLSEIEPDRACQLCIVEVAGKIVRACSTPVSEGLTINTDSEKVQELRRNTMTAILRRHPHSCLTCHRRERCGPLDVCLRQVAVEDR
ncbi:MAG: 2Fe-2S iron-sulfur cluster-binding protein, partial [Dehalococcoidia bacterium]